MANLLDLPKLIDYTVSVEPYWGSDAGRHNMTGDFSGTFNGYYTTIELSFGKCTQEELFRIKQILQKPTFELTYPDPDTQNTTTYTEQFYGTAIKNRKTNVNGKYDPFVLSVIAVKKKTNII